MNILKSIIKSKTFILLVALIIGTGVLTGSTMYVNSRTYNITLDDDGQMAEFVTREASVGDLLEKHEIKLGEGDIVKPSLDKILEDDMNIQIVRAMKVNVFADGQSKDVFLTEGKVSDALEEVGVNLREHDIVNYSLYNELRDFMHIVVNRVDVAKEVASEPVPYKVVARDNNNMDYGTERVIQEGKEGVRETEYTVTYKDGKEIYREQLGQKVALEPVERIVEKGTIRTLQTSRGSLRYIKKETFNVSAYSATVEECDASPTITASGSRVKPFHTIAAHQRFPFGTKLYIPYMVKYWANRGVDFDGIYVVSDRFCAPNPKYYNRADIYMETKSQCYSFGRRHLEIYILK